jgi:DNA repair protein RecO (recombination protein O)
MHNIDNQSAYILHSRPYRETSLLLELFTSDYGRVSAVAKGVRAPKAKARGLLQPFVHLLISCGGRGDLLTLKNFESTGPVLSLLGRRLVSGFYLNELLVRLLHKYDPHPDIFLSYQQTLFALEQASCQQIPLRLFEKSLLKGLGYELQLIKEVENGHTVQEDKLYLFDPERGPAEIEAEESYRHHTQKPIKGIFKGKSLLALASDELAELSVLNDAKRLLRQALAVHLGTKPIESRKLLL